MDDFDKKIRQIKNYRQPDIFLENIFSNVQKYYLDNISNNMVFYKHEKFLFQYETECGFLYYDNELYNEINIKYHYDYLKCCKIIANKFSDILQLKCIMANSVNCILTSNFLPLLKLAEK